MTGIIRVHAAGGPEVRFRRGARVAYAQLPGSYSEARLVPADRAIAPPDEVSDEAAASTLLRGMTVEVLRRCYNVADYTIDSRTTTP